MKQSDIHTPVPPIFVINMEKSKDRREYIRAQFEAMGIKFHFFNAIDGKKLSSAELDTIDFIQAEALCGHQLSLGEVGCALSHIRIYEKCLAESIDEVIILEDDITVPEYFHTVLQAIAKRKNPHSELLYLFHGKAKTWPLYKKLPYNFKIKKVIPPSATSSRFITGTVGYYINKSGMQKLLSHAYPVRMPADYLTGFIQRSGINCYTIEPNLLALAGFDTTIDDRNYGDHLHLDHANTIS